MLREWLRLPAAKEKDDEQERVNRPAYIVPETLSVYGEPPVLSIRSPVPEQRSSGAFFTRRNTSVLWAR
jgi:hypothetical protein